VADKPPARDRVSGEPAAAAAAPATSSSAAAASTRDSDSGRVGNGSTTLAASAAKPQDRPDTEPVVQGARPEVPSSRVPAGEVRRSERGDQRNLDVPTEAGKQVTDGAAAEKGTAAETVDGESAENSVPVARTAAYQEEAAELLEAASRSTPARRRRKTTGAPTAEEPAEPTVKATRTNRRGTSTRPPAKG
jgi:hypothetical protein